MGGGPDRTPADTASNRRSVALGGLETRFEHQHRLLRHRHGDEQMVVMKSGDRVAGDSFARERRRHRGEEADRREIGLDGEGDPGRFEGARDAVPLRLFGREHQRQPLSLAKRRQRRHPFASEISGETAEEIDARLQLRFRSLAGDG